MGHSGWTPSEMSTPVSLKGKSYAILEGSSGPQTGNKAAGIWSEGREYV